MSMDAFDVYMTTLRKANYPRFNKEEELELALAKEQGDAEASEKLVQSCLPLVVYCAKRYFKHHHWLSPLDIIQEGNMGLMRAVEKFQPWRFNTRLTTYATWWIKQHIMRYAEGEKSGIIHIPYDVAGGRRAPALEEQPGTTEQLLNGGMLSMNYSAYSGAGGADASEFGDRLPQSTEPTAAELDDAMEYQEQLSHLLYLIGMLDDRQQIIIRDRMVGGSNNTLEVIGARLGITRERVRQVEMQCRTKLHALFKKHPFVPNNGNGKAMSRAELPGVNCSQPLSEPPMDPFAALEKITLDRVEGEIHVNNQELELAKTKHKQRATYLKKLREVVATRDGVSLSTGKPKMKVGDIISEYLKGKPQQTIDQIMMATGLTRLQAGACLRMSSKYKKDKADRWSMK